MITIWIDESHFKLAFFLHPTEKRTVSYNLWTWAKLALIILDKNRRAQNDCNQCNVVGVVFVVVKKP